MPDSADPELKIIEAIYRGACDAAELALAVELIAQYFDSAGALLGEMDCIRPEAQFMTGVRTIDHAFVADYQSVADIDPAPRLFTALQTGTASTTDRIFSKEVLRTDVFRNEFLRPRGIDAALSGPLLSEGGRFALVAVHHAVNRESFGDEDIARLERLMPHLTRALQIRRLFLQNESRGQALESVVNRIPTGMIGVSDDGPALFVNDAARAMAAARDGLSLDRHGRLVAADRATVKRLAALEADVAQGGAGGLVRVPRRSGAHRTSYWCRRCPRATTYCQKPATAFCSPSTTRAAGSSPPCNGSRICCMCRRAPPRSCRRSSKGSS